MYFIEEFVSWECVYFAACFLGIQQNMWFSSSFYTTVVSDGLHEPYLLLTTSSFILILSDSHWGCLIWVKFVEFWSKNLKASLMSFTCTLFSDKVRCFNQSKRALYGDFIIILNTNQQETLWSCKGLSRCHLLKFHPPFCFWKWPENES